MPIYEYNCKKCGDQFEVLIRGKSDQPVKCPKCGASDPVKIFSTFAVATHGSVSHCDSCPSGGDAGCASGACSPDACPFSS